MDYMNNKNLLAIVIVILCYFIHLSPPSGRLPGWMLASPS
jgi:hypothetical protein